MEKNSENDNPIPTKRRNSFSLVWIAGCIGCLSFLPTIIKFIPINKALPFSTTTLIALSILQSVIFITIFALTGAVLAAQIGFRTILADLPITKKIFWINLKQQFYYGAALVVTGAVAAYFLAHEFIDYLSFFPIISRLFGSLFEEVAIRWCLLTLFVWILWRVFQHSTGIPKRSLIWSGIILNQVLFASAHTFSLIKLGATNPIWSVVTIFFVSLPWGWLFWKKGIEAAFIAHASFHAAIALLAALRF